MDGNGNGGGGRSSLTLVSGLELREKGGGGQKRETINQTHHPSSHPRQKLKKRPTQDYTLQSQSQVIS